MDKVKEKLRDLVPQHTLHGLDNYVKYHCPAGDFLTAVLSNDLREACAHADLLNQRSLFEIMCYIYNCIPLNSWGSPELVAEWTELKVGAICSTCKRTVSVPEHSRGRTDCCHANVGAEEYDGRS